MRSIITAALAISLVTTSVAEWETVELDGQVFVTADSVAAYYRFEPPLEKDGFLVFNYKDVKCQLPLEGRFAIMNGLRVDVETPLVKHEERFLVPRLMLVKTIDPLLRPGSIQSESRPKTLLVYADPESDALAKELVTVICAKPFDDLKVERLAGGSAKSILEKINRRQDALFLLVRVTRGDPALRTRALAPAGLAGFGNILKKAHLETLAGNQVDPLNLALAAAVHGAVHTSTEFPDDGLVRSRDPWMKGSRHPSLILELRFPEASDEGAFVQATAKAVRWGIARFLVATRETR